MLIECQCNMLSNPIPANAALELEANRKWLVLSNAEEKFFRQRSNISWLRDGDCNSRYFHRMVNTRRAINHIHFLETESGERVTTMEAIQEVCVSYYMNLLGNEVPPPLFLQEDISNILDFSCSVEQQAQMQADFSSEEIKEAFLSLP